MSKSRAHSVLGGHKKKKGGKSKVHKMEIRHAANGGFIVEHKRKPSDMQDPEEHQIGDMDQLKQHVEDNMGQQPDAEEPGEQAEAAPAAAPGPVAQ